MIKKVDIMVERFREGATFRWNDSHCSMKSLATAGQEPKSIGEIIWEDIKDIFDKTQSDDVIVSIEYNDMKD